MAKKDNVGSFNFGFNAVKAAKKPKSTGKARKSSGIRTGKDGRQYGS